MIGAATGKARRREKAAKVVLYAASGFTIAVLLAVITYIVYHGFVSDNIYDGPFIAKGSEALCAGQEHDVQVSVILNRGVHCNDLDLHDLATLFGWSGRTSWARVSEQDMKVYPFVGLEDSREARAFAHTVFPDDRWADLTVFLPSDVEIIERVANTQGGVGVIRAESASQATETRGVRVVPVRCISVLASPDVLELRNNVRLRNLTESQLTRVFSGEVDNWLEVGGLDLPLRVVAFSPQSDLTQQFQRLVLGDAGMAPGAQLVGSWDQLTGVLDSSSGAVGYFFGSDALAQREKQVVELRRRVVKSNMSWEFLTKPPREAGVVGGISTVILNTLVMIALVVVFSTPIGIAAAVYLTEYAKQGRLVQILRFGTEILSGIPSIIFGLFGFIFFATYLRLGIGLITGTLTITMMLLPTIIRTSEEAIKAVPMALREGSLALGATKWQTVVRVTIPTAVPGILTGVILAIGRAVGETAALLFTMGTQYELVKSLRSGSRVLAVHLYFLVKEGLSFDRAFATGTILVVVVLLVNYATNTIVKRRVMNR